MSVEEIISRTRLLDNDVKVGVVCHVTYLLFFSYDTQIMKSEIARISHEQQSMKDKIKVKNINNNHRRR